MTELRPGRAAVPCPGAGPSAAVAPRRRRRALPARPAQPGAVLSVPVSGRRNCTVLPVSRDCDELVVVGRQPELQRRLGHDGVGEHPGPRQRHHVLQFAQSRGRKCPGSAGRRARSPAAPATRSARAVLAPGRFLIGDGTSSNSDLTHSGRKVMLLPASGWEWPRPACPVRVYRVRQGGAGGGQLPATFRGSGRGQRSRQGPCVLRWCGGTRSCRRCASRCTSLCPRAAAAVRGCRCRLGLGRSRCWPRR